MITFQGQGATAPVSGYVSGEGETTGICISLYICVHLVNLI